LNNEFLKYKGWALFAVISGIYLLIAFALNYLFVTDSLYYQSFGQQLTIEQINKLLIFFKKWRWFSYILLPFGILPRIIYTTVILYISVFLSNIKIGLRKLFKVALLADFVYVLAALIKLIILIFFKEVNTLTDLQFQPLSLIELLNKNAIDPLFVYPLSLLNAFELLYWLALAWLLTGIVNQSFGKSLKMVASSYGAGLLLWVLFVMFLTVNLGS